VCVCARVCVCDLKLLPRCEIFAVLGCYAALTGNSWFASPLKMEQTDCPETSVTTNHCRVTSHKREDRLLLLYVLLPQKSASVR
jgi:hypothetical protein